MQNKVKSQNKLKSTTRVIVSIAILSLSFLFSSLSYSNTPSSVTPGLTAPEQSSSQTKTIAISQIVAHPALDAVREGIIEGLKQAGYEEQKNLVVLYQNAQGDIGLASQIAVKFISDRIDAAIGIATPAAQTLFYQAKKSKNKIPVIFTAVSDPASANLDPGPEHYPITGVTDAPPLEPLVTLMKKLQPEIHTLGILYNPAEINSVTTIDHLKPLLKQQKITLIEVAVNKTQDITLAMQQLTSKVEAIYFPQDNTVVSGIETVSKIAAQQGIPLFCNDPVLIEKGVLAAVGYDYKEMGVLTGKIVARILQGEAASLIPIVHPQTFKTVVNEPLLNSFKAKPAKAKTP